MTSKCYDCIYCSVDRKYRKICTILQQNYALIMGKGQECNFFKTHAQDEAIKRACAKRLVEIGRIKSEDEYYKNYANAIYTKTPANKEDTRNDL